MKKIKNILINLSLLLIISFSKNLNSMDKALLGDNPGDKPGELPVVPGGTGYVAPVFDCHNANASRQTVCTSCRAIIYTVKSLHSGKRSDCKHGCAAHKEDDEPTIETTYKTCDKCKK